MRGYVMIGSALRHYPRNRSACLRGAIVVCLVLSVLVPVGLAGAITPLPHAFCGTILINGDPAPSGTVVTAKVGGIEYGSITTVYPGKYGSDETGAYGPGILKLIVQGEDIENGARVDFYVGTAQAAQAASFFSGEVTEFALTFELTTVTLTVEVVGAGAASPPAGPHQYYEGEVVSICAIPSADCYFDCWSGEVGSMGDAGCAETTVTMNADYTVRANFFFNWDVNGDGCISVLDVILVGQHWGETGDPRWATFDVNGDGAVSVLDVILVGQHWGEGCGG
jgi:hypothetical protein